jgi:predicted nucleotidyltransferase
VSLLSSAQLKVLGRLTEAWKGRRFCLIGAGALHAHRPDYFRETKDLDITVSVSVDEFGSAMQGLPEFARHKTKEHEWMGPAGVRLDIIPAGPTLIAAGGLVWPESGHHMSLVGFRLALERCAPKQMGPGLTVPVAPLDVIVLLKMVAYLDRPGEPRGAPKSGH